VLWALLLAGALVRGAVTWAYSPGLFYFDSWLYLGMVARGNPVEFAPDRPIGYAALLKLALSTLGGLTSVIALQHLAGLGVAMLVYRLLTQLGAHRAVALTATGVIALDGYEIALEQHVLPEAFFALTLLGSVYLLVAGRLTTARVTASGLLLAGAVLLRTAGVFAIPAWIAFVLVSLPDVGRRLVAVSALLAPLAVYVVLFGAVTGELALSESDGWFLYQRVAHIGDCREIQVPRSAMALCNMPPSYRPQDPSEYIYGPESPAVRAFGPLAGTSARVAHANSVLRAYALAVIEQHPVAYLKLVAGDFLRFFEPDVASPGRESLTYELPPRHLLLYWDDPPLRDTLFSDYRPVVHGPAAATRAYVRWVHLPGWVIGVLALASLLAAVRRLVLGRERRSSTPAALLLFGVALCILLGSVASTLFRVRYLIPTEPLLICAIALTLFPAAPRWSGAVAERAG
jgi:hypothetical protein